MSPDPGSEGSWEGRRRPVSDPLGRLAQSLGIELPLFEGPLAAFRLGGVDPDAPIYLGGDLHATHPDATARALYGTRDPTLDDARIVISDTEHEALETSAVGGIWCISIGGGLTQSAPYLSLYDSRGRIRSWLILPPPRLMVGIGHYWLPSVPPLSGPGADPPQGH